MRGIRKRINVLDRGGSMLHRAEADTTMRAQTTDSIMSATVGGLASHAVRTAPLSYIRLRTKYG